MILAFTGLSFLSTFEQPRPGITKVYEVRRTTMSNVVDQWGPESGCETRTSWRIDAQRALEPEQ